MSRPATRLRFFDFAPFQKESINMTTTPSFRRLRHAACGLLLTLTAASALAADKDRKSVV